MLNLFIPILIFFRPDRWPYGHQPLPACYGLSFATNLSCEFSRHLSSHFSLWER